MKTYKIKVNGRLFEVELEAVSESDGHIDTPVQAAPASGAVAGSTIVTPIAGKVLDIKVKVGDVIHKGQTVAVIEAMKLENEVPATADGKVVDIRVSKGMAVNNKDVLVVLG